MEDWAFIKLHKLKFRKLQKPLHSKQPSGLYFNLSPIHCNNVTYLKHLNTAFRSSHSVCHQLSFSSFQVKILLQKHLLSDHKISCPPHNLERTNNNPFTVLRGLRHMTTSKRVIHQSWVTRCSPCILKLNPFMTETLIIQKLVSI